MKLFKRLFNYFFGRGRGSRLRRATEATGVTMQDAKFPNDPARAFETRMRTLYFGTVLILLTLVVQFILGMATNLFVTLPATSNLLQALRSGDPILVAHMSVAFVLLALGVGVAALGFRRPIPRKVSALSLGGVLAIFWAFESGVEFVLSGFTNSVASFSMASGFLGALVLYGVLGLVSGLNGGRLLDSSLVLQLQSDESPKKDRQARS